MKKGLFFLLICLFVLVAFPDPGEAASQSRIVLDGQDLTLPEDVEVTIVNKSVMVPIRVVAENLKFAVKWDQANQNVFIQHDSSSLSLTVGQKTALASNQQIELNTEPLMKKNTVLVPIRLVSEQMGLNVKWNNQEKIVYLTKNAVNEAPSDSVLPEEGGLTGEIAKLIHEIAFVNEQLIVSIDGEITPIITTLSGPERIVVDLPNVNFSEQFQPIDSNMTGKLDVSSYPNIKEIRYSLFQRDPGQVRIVIELMQGSSTSFKSELIADKLVVTLVPDTDSGGGIIPLLPAPAGENSDSSRKIVVIDPGHGGSDPGTTSITNRHEKDFNLALSLKIQALLLNEPAIEVVMTRDSDVYPTRDDRVQLANQLQADVFVSIHGNSVLSSPQTTGTETFYYQRSSSKSLADMIHPRLVQAMGLKDRGVKNGNFQVIRETTMPAVLLEVGFLSNRADEQAMLSETNQQKAAQAIVDGIKEYLGLL